MKWQPKPKMMKRWAKKTRRYGPGCCHAVWRHHTTLARSSPRLRQRGAHLNGRRPVTWLDACWRMAYINEDSLLYAHTALTPSMFLFLFRQKMIYNFDKKTQILMKYCMICLLGRYFLHHSFFKITLNLLNIYNYILTMN